MPRPLSTCSATSVAVSGSPSPPPSSRGAARGTSRCCRPTSMSGTRRRRRGSSSGRPTSRRGAPTPSRRSGRRWPCSTRTWWGRRRCSPTPTTSGCSPFSSRSCPSPSRSCAGCVRSPWPPPTSRPGAWSPSPPPWSRASGGRNRGIGYRPIHFQEPRPRCQKGERAMRRLTTMLVSVLVLGLWVGSASAQVKVKLQPFADGLLHPLVMLNPPDGSKRFFIVEQSGTIQILMPDGKLRPTPFLDLSKKMVKLDWEFDERGLLGLAFHPKFKDNGKFYVVYTAPVRTDAARRPRLLFCCTNYLSEFQVSKTDPN